jgi:hypothetical protein
VLLPIGTLGVGIGASIGAAAINTLARSGWPPPAASQAYASLYANLAIGRFIEVAFSLLLGVALILGVVGLFQPNKFRTAPTIAIIISAILVILILTANLVHPPLPS